MEMEKLTFSLTELVTVSALSEQQNIPRQLRLSLTCDRFIEKLASCPCRTLCSRMKEGNVFI